MTDKVNKIDKFLLNEDKNIYIFGNISEKMSFEVVADLVELSANIVNNGMINPEITIFLNTEGGDLTEMYAIYDMIKFVQNKGIDVSIIGLGKVMSAGLTLLGAGTKGKRKVSKNTRLMFHEIRTEYSGDISELRAEIKESDFVQDQYLTCLVNDTSKNRAHYEQILKERVNHYFSPETAIEWGLADEVFDLEDMPPRTVLKSKGKTSVPRSSIREAVKKVQASKKTK